MRDPLLTHRRTHATLKTTAVALVLQLLALAALGALAAPASAHTPHDSIVDVAISANYAEDRTVYSISRTLLLKSTDGGESWSELQSSIPSIGLLRSVAVAPTDSDVVYVGGFDGLFKSTDGATTFTRVAEMGSQYVAGIQIAPWDDDVVATTTRAGQPPRLHTPTEAWSPIEGFTGVTTVAFADDEGVLFVGDDDGNLRMTDDSGDTWTQLTVDDAPVSIKSIAVSPAYADDGTLFVATASAGVYRSEDRGASFTQLTDGLSDPETISVAVSPSFDTDGTVWVSTFSDGVFKSDDEGDNWSFRGSGLTKSDQADLLERNHFDKIIVARTGDGEPATLFLAGFNGLFVTRDGADSWAETQTQLATIIMGVAVSPTYADDGTVFLTTYINGLFKSSDGAETWEAINNGVVSRFDWTRSPNYVNRLFPTALSPNFAEDQTAFTVSRGQIYRSTDGGGEWESIIPEGAIVEGEFPPDYFFLGISPEFADDATILVGTDGGKIFRSTDAGMSYSRLPDIGVEVTSLVLSPGFATDATAFAGTVDGVHVTRDGGTSWQFTNWPEGRAKETSLAITPTFVDDETLFAGTEVGLLSTSDGGDTWSPSGGSTPVSTGTVESVAVSPDFENDQTVLASIRGHGLFRSTDGGTTWAPIGESLLTDNLVFSNFYHATSEPIVFSPTFATDRTIFGFDGSSLLQSVDGGESWDLVERPTTEHDTNEDSAPGELRDTPRFEGSSEEPQDTSDTPDTPDATPSDTTDDDSPSEPAETATTPGGRADPELSLRKLIFSAAAALLALAVLVFAERVPARARWIYRGAAATTVFFGILWLLMRR